MADEDEDETFPPETIKQPTEFAFREFGRLIVTTEENDSTFHLRNNLLAAANTFGLVFVGYPTGFKVYNDSELFASSKQKGKIPDVVADVVLRSSPHWLAVSSDNLTLVVCCSGEKGLQALFFDARNLVNQAKPTKTPFHVLPLSKSSTDAVVSIHWNPSLEATHYLAICGSSGAFHMLSVTDDVHVVGQKPAEFGACCVCWSPRGKQVMVGKADGSMQQYTPTLEIRRTVPVYDAVEMKVKVADVLWLSTLQVAFSYVPNTDEGDSQPSLFVVNLPPAKEVTKPPSWRNYEDPCYGEPGTRPPHFMTSYIDKWSMFVIASAHGSETAVIGKDRKAEVWEIWNLDDSCRAQLPMEEGKEEPWPLGCTVLYTAKDRIVVDDTRECSAMPVFAMLSCDGSLNLFHMINLQSAEEYPNIVVQPKSLTPDGERAAVVNKLGSWDNSKGPPSFGGKAKLLSKPSMLVTTSTPKQPRDPQITDNLQLSMTPLQGRGGHLPLREGGTLPPPAELDSTTKFAPRTLGFSGLGPPFVPLSGNDRPSQIETRAASSGVTPLPVYEATSAKKPTLEKTFSLSTPRDERGSPIPANDPPSQPVSRPSSNTPSKHQSSISSLSIGSAVTGQGKEAKGPGDNVRRRTARRSQDKAQLPQDSATSSIMDGLISEVADFEQELSGFIEDSTHTEDLVASLGSVEDQVELKMNMDVLSHFQQEITRTSKEQHDEIQSVRTLSLEAFAALQNVETQRRRVVNPAYRDALYAKPLDMSDQRRMKEIRGWYQYIRDTLKEVDNTLNDQWHAFMEKQKSSALRQSKRRIELEERNSVRQAISNQTRILHDYELKLLLLDQQLDRLRLANTSLQHYDVASPHSKHSSTLGQVGDSTDLPTMASSLIRKNTGESPKMELGDVANTSASKKNSFTQISPQKACQLSDYLASKKSTLVRPLAGRKSRFIAKPFVKAPSSRVSPPSVGKSLSTRSVSHTSESTAASEESITTSGSPTSVEKPEESEVPGHMFGSGGGAVPESTFIRNDGPPILARRMTPVFPSFHTPSPTPGKASEPDKHSLAKASPTPPPQSTSLEGSATITYGGPDTPLVKPVVKYNTTSAQAEAASNLNNPPQVINIKELNDPEIVNVVPFSQKFQAKADVPPGVASEMQKVLNAVQASQKQQPSSPFKPPTSADDHAAVPSAIKQDPAKPDVTKTEATKSDVTTAAQPSTSLPSLSGPGPFGQQPSSGMPFSSSFTMKTPGQGPFAFTPVGSTPSDRTVTSSPRGLGPPNAAAGFQPPKSSSGAPASGSFPSLFSLVASGKPRSEPDNGGTSHEEEKPVDDEGAGPHHDVPRSVVPPPEIIPSAIQEPSSNRNVGVYSPAVTDTSTPPPELEPVPPSNEDSSSSVAPPAEPLVSSTAPPLESDIASKDVPPESSHGASSSAPKPKDQEDTKEQPGPPPLSAAPSNVFGVNAITGRTSSFGNLGDAASSLTRSEPKTGLFSQGLAQPTNQSPQPGLFQLLKSSSASGSGSSGPRAATPTTTPSIFHQSVASAPASLVSIKTAALTSTSSGGEPPVSAPPVTGGGLPVSAPSVAVEPQASDAAPQVEIAPEPSGGLSTSAFGGGPVSSAPPIENATLLPTPSPSAFGAPPVSSTPLAFNAASTTSAPPLFGTAPSASTGSGFGAFGSQTNPSSAFGGAPSTNAFQAFGSTAPDGFNSTTTGFGSSSGGFGGGFLSGLGSTPKQQSTNSNPFASVETENQSSDNKSLFGNSASSPFSSGFGQAATSSAFGAKPAEQQQTFGAFAKPASAAFGSAPVFGSPSGFGAKSAFGTAAQFGGSASFGSPSSGFGSPAAFGAQAGTPQGNQPGGSFGTSTSGFGAFANVNTPGFGALAEQSGGGGGGFGSSSNQQPVFGGGFGSQSQGFGSASAPSFGSATQNTGFGSSAFGSNPKPSFSGWR